MFIVVSQNTVSYTHLDVYKRQVTIYGTSHEKKTNMFVYFKTTKNGGKNQQNYDTNLQRRQDNET